MIKYKYSDLWPSLKPYEIEEMNYNKLLKELQYKAENTMIIENERLLYQDEMKRKNTN